MTINTLRGIVEIGPYSETARKAILAALDLAEAAMDESRGNYAPSELRGEVQKLREALRE